MSKTITGAEFRDFYRNHWPAGCWHEDAEYEIEDDFGTWLLQDDRILEIDRMGYVVSGDLGGKQTWRGFAEVWEAWKGEAPAVHVMTWRVPAELVQEVTAFMEERGIRPVAEPAEPPEPSSAPS